MSSTLEKYRVQPRGAGRLEKYRVQKGPGSTPETAVNQQHPDLGWWERSKLMNLTGGQDTAAVRHLESLGFEARPLGDFRFAIRKPGEKSWYQTEKSGGMPEFSDITDVIGGAATTAGMVTGGVAGTAGGALLGTPAAPGVGTVALGLAGGVAGSAAGGAAVEGSLHGVGKLLGMGITPRESLSAMGHEAAAGAIGEVGGRALGYVGGKVLQKFRGPAARVGEALEKPLKVERAEKALGREHAAEDAARATFREAREGVAPYREALETHRANVAAKAVARKAEERAFKPTVEGARTQALRAEEQAFPLKEDLRGAAAETAGAAYERKAAAMEFKEMMRQRVQNATQDAEEAIARGKAEAQGLEFEPTGYSQSTTKRVEETIRRNAGEVSGRLTRMQLPTGVADPAWGVTSKALEKFPSLGAVLRKHLGKNFHPVDELGEKFGSTAMQSRSRRLAQQGAEKGADWWNETSPKLTEDLAAWMLGNPEFNAGLSEAVRAPLRAAAAGKITPELASKVVTTFQEHLTGRAITPRLAAAQRALEEAQLGQMGARKALLKSPEAGKLSEAQMRKRLAAEPPESLKRARGEYDEAVQGRMGAGDRMLSSSEMKAFRGARRGLSAQGARTARARATVSALDPKASEAERGMGWLGSRMLPKLLTKPAEMGARRGMAFVGRQLRKLAAEDPQAFFSAAAGNPDVPAGVRALAQRVNGAKNPKYARALAMLLVRSPMVQGWLEGSGN